MTETPDPIYIIRRADGDEILGEYAFMGCDGPDDWTVPDETEDGSRIIDYEILQCRRVAVRTFGEPEPEPDDEDEQAVTS